VAINAKWHAKNKMPKNATLEERVRWHEEHARECGCRAIPPAVQDAIEKKPRR
jgi:hypothetical protein